ncbi:DUF4440 domain-containing protein [Paenibacillus zeisoli]|uniref:DUF4440 domain-containing protein n=1 Tax=Paenibacillus zeisoli TaxID=2496267 RepID=A0A433XHY5_9BACL|nr:DUF4440 domain-containing protein [Paenibacillus zeisoli]RUT33681.1 DUF4440 domain-containing protein [Paenibacillus zeisoli]
MTTPIRSNSVRNPEDMNTAFADAFNSGEINNLLSLYEPDSILINLSGSKDKGIASIQKTLEELLQLRGNMVSKNIYCIPFENIALLRAHFILEAVSPDGKPIHLEGHTSEVIRQQSDGSWLYIVDHPFGADLLDRVSAI